MKEVFKHQIGHAILLGVLLISINIIISLDLTLLSGKKFGMDTKNWMLIAILVPVIHQKYVLVCWRLELHHKSLTKTFASSAFNLFKLGFGLLFVLRLLTIIVLAIANQNSLHVHSIFVYILSGVFAFLSLYTLYSVRKYFSIDRAMGIDHFEPDKYKAIPFVKKGMFKYSSNSMYVFGLLILWIPGLLLLSKAALIVAIFNHTYIWVHYYFVELPDIKVIYGN